MKQRVDNEPAYVLHSRNYTDSKLIVEFFTRNSGRIRAVYRPPSRKASRAGRPQAFVPSSLSFYGSNELKTVRALETTAAPMLTAGTSLFCGMYLNELLQKLLPPELEQAKLFAAYHLALSQLAHAHGGEEDIPLRVFELSLLAELGYAISFEVDATGQAIVDDASTQYTFVPTEGFVLASAVEERPDAVFSGAAIRSVAAEHWRKEGVRALSKRVLRKAIENLLDGRELVSRQLFR